MITSASFPGSSGERMVIASTTLPQAAGSWPALKLRIPHVDGYFTGTGAEPPVALDVKCMAAGLVTHTPRRLRILCTLGYVYGRRIDGCHGVHQLVVDCSLAVTCYMITAAAHLLAQYSVHSMWHDADVYSANVLLSTKHAPDALYCGAGAAQAT